MDNTLTQIIQDLFDAHAEKARLEQENAFLRGQVTNLTKPKAVTFPEGEVSLPGPIGVDADVRIQGQGIALNDG